ncbi:lysyl oxidase family protein [Haloterrigena sp. H1]|uniref:lysyl oxidase family protein n=1 Tax=Haloterrigena sp. H1 TaxID=2552943 RepID=UPI002016BDD6|nr:lysyl oxidase family protein [Haloterrigena sp. H1]
MGILLYFFSLRSEYSLVRSMKIRWVKGRKRAAALMGVLLIVVAGVGIITLGGVAVDNPFTVDDSSTDTPTTSGSEGAADEEAIPAGEENSTTPPPTTAESDPEPSDDQVEDRSGVNFVPGVRDFNVSTEVFDESSPDVEDGFVTPGEHRLLRFDMIIYNMGDTDAELGRPENRPDLFEYSESHGHAHLKGFNKYILLDKSGQRTGAVRKQTFCLRDLYQTRSTARSSSQFDCEYQGISAGWADEYDASLPGQYIVIDDLPDGEYTLQATTNAAGTIDETCDGDNTVRVDLSIKNDIVTVHTSQSHYVRPSAC